MVAAATVNATNANLNPKRIPYGLYLIDLEGIVIESTSLDYAADRANIAAILAGHTLVAWCDAYWDAGDTGATPDLDADLVISEDAEDPSSAGTETTLYNASTAFSAAVTLANRTYLYFGHKVNDTYNGVGYVRFLVNVAAATADDMTLHGYLLCSAP